MIIYLASQHILLCLFVCLLAKQCICHLMVQKILVVGTLGMQNVNFFYSFGGELLS